MRDSKQACSQCDVMVKPYRTDELQRGSGGGGDRRGAHRSDLCQRCLNGIRCDYWKLYIYQTMDMMMFWVMEDALCSPMDISTRFHEPNILTIFTELKYYVNEDDQWDLLFHLDVDRRGTKFYVLFSNQQTCSDQWIPSVVRWWWDYHSDLILFIWHLETIPNGFTSIIPMMTSGIAIKFYYKY